MRTALLFVTLLGGCAAVADPGTAAAPPPGNPNGSEGTSAGGYYPDAPGGDPVYGDMSTGSAAQDSGSAAQDSGSAAQDSGSAAQDSGSAAQDSGSAAQDSGTTHPPCGAAQSSCCEGNTPCRGALQCYEGKCVPTCDPDRGRGKGDDKFGDHTAAPCVVGRH